MLLVLPIDKMSSSPLLSMLIKYFVAYSQCYGGVYRRTHSFKLGNVIIRARKYLDELILQILHPSPSYLMSLIRVVLAQHKLLYH